MTIIKTHIRPQKDQYHEEALLHSFHKQGWEDRINIVQEINDDRYRQLGQRIIATERADLLTDHQRKRWDVWRRERLCANGDNPWLTVARTLEELSNLTETAKPDQKRQLTDLKRFLITVSN